jgi:16S rRNA (adenine1518-N6/adenine1519-N6)-dimethyltransferase
LDQNFLIDSGVLEREVRYSEIDEQDTVLEIGPGLGFLTERLARAAKKVIAIERDKRLEPVLKGELSSFSNVEFIFADCIDIEWPKFDAVVSNIPYSISAPFTFKLLDYSFESATICYQKEFAEKMVTEPGYPNYGRLSVMTQYYFEPEILEVVPKSAFWPQPKVDSAVVDLNPREGMERDKKFDDFVRELFRYSSKNVRNAVQIAFKKDIEDNRKVDTLGIPEIKELYKKCFG